MPYYLDGLELTDDVIYSFYEKESCCIRHPIKKKNPSAKEGLIHCLPKTFSVHPNMVFGLDDAEALVEAAIDDRNLLVVAIEIHEEGMAKSLHPRNGLV